MTNVNKTMDQQKLKAKISNLYQAWEKELGQVTIGFNTASDWLRKLREFFLFFQPITERSDAIVQNREKELHGKVGKDFKGTLCDGISFIVIVNFSFSGFFPFR